MKEVWTLEVMLAINRNRKNLEEILEVKTFLKMSIGFKCRGLEVELQFCSFLGCVHFSTDKTFM